MGCVRPSAAGCDIVPAGGVEALISCGGEEKCGARYSLLLCSYGCVSMVLVPSALALAFLVSHVVFLVHGIPSVLNLRKGLSG